jgi:hypothetical protein
VKNKDNVFSTRHVEGIERAAALITFPQCNANYRCYRWGRFTDHWLLELVTGDQVEVYDLRAFVHIPRDGWTFELDGTVRELQKSSLIEVVQ